MMVALTLVVGSTLTSVSQLPVQQSTDAQPIRVVSVTSGTQGEARNGRYFILDPRATFHVPEDQKIIVSFQWLGIPGKHQMTGTWKGPGISTTNGFDYVAQGREFGAYWTLPLTAEAPEGSWTFEAQVDGQPAGTYTFEVRHGAGDPLVPSAPKTPGPVPLTRQEMFAKALGATVSVESLDATGRQIARGPGTLMDSNTIATSFSVINAASKLRVRVGKNTPIDLDSVLTWDRRRDWATLRISGPADISAPALVPSRPSVGSTCATVGAAGDGAYSVTGCDVVGLNDYQEAGARFSLSLYNGLATAGAPVLDDFGRLFGVVSSGIFPRTGESAYVATTVGALPILVIPIDALKPSATATQTALKELAASGVFVPPVTMGRNVGSGGFAMKMLRDGPRTQPVDEKTEFSVQDKAIVVFLNWYPKENLKGMAVMRLYGIDNRVLGESKPIKTTLRPGTVLISSWQLTLPTSEGDYRVDVSLDDTIAWRGYFHLK